MTNFAELMAAFSVPRPNGSRALRQTSQFIKDWLEHKEIPFTSQPFSIYPYFFECIGLWLILSRLLLALALWLRWGWPAAVIAAIGLSGGLLDVALNLPLVTWPGKQQAENILIEFSPHQVRQELVLCAHYDSKTELLDHHKRMFFLKNLRTGILLTALLGALGPIDRWLLDQASPWSSATYVVGVILSLLLLGLALGLGLNLTTGRLLKPSQGAVDNGAACAILLGLAERLQHEYRLASSSPDYSLPLQHTRLTLAVFAGEEVNMQGSRAFLRQRFWRFPVIALNLEVMAQDGEYVIWEQDGNSLRIQPVSSELNDAVSQAVAAVTGQVPRRAGPLNSDGGSFLTAGIQATTLGTYDSLLVDTGFHRPTDNLSRVVMDRLPEGVNILAQFLFRVDRGEFLFPTSQTTRTFQGDADHE